MMTEWQQYLTQCIETIALVAEVLPLQVFEQVVSTDFRIDGSTQSSYIASVSLVSSTMNGVAHSRYSNPLTNQSTRMGHWQ